jgi:hypothetical protein
MWTVEEVVSWAASEGLSVSFLDALSLRTVDGAKLLSLTKASVVELGLVEEHRAENFLALLSSLDPDSSQVVESGSMLYLSKDLSPATGRERGSSTSSQSDTSSRPVSVPVSPSTDSSTSTVSSTRTSSRSSDTNSEMAMALERSMEGPSLACSELKRAEQRARRKSAGDISHKYTSTAGCPLANTHPSGGGIAGDHDCTREVNSAQPTRVLPTVSDKSGKSDKAERSERQVHRLQDFHRFVGATDSVDRIRRRPLTNKQQQQRKGVSFPAKSAVSSAPESMAKRWSSAQVEEWCLRTGFWKYYLAFLAEETLTGSRLLRLRKLKQLKKVSMDKAADADLFLKAVARLSHFQNSPTQLSPLLFTGVSAHVLNDHAFSDPVEHIQTLKDLVIAMHVQLME